MSPGNISTPPATTSIVIAFCGCHSWDLAQRFQPLVSRVRTQVPHRSIAGVFWQDGESSPPVGTGPFDDLVLCTTPSAVAKELEKLAPAKLIIFVDHNPTIRDCDLYAAIKRMSPPVVVLYRNLVSLSRYLTTGDDDSASFQSCVAAVRARNRSDRLKSELLGGLVCGMLMCAGLLRAVAGGRREQRRQILFLRLDLLGDMTVTLPYLAAVKRCFPDAELTVLASPKGAALLKPQGETAPSVFFDRLEVWDAPWHRDDPGTLGGAALREMLSRLPLLWRRNFDIVLQPVNFGTGILFALLCLGRRVAAPIDPRLPLSAKLGRYLTDPVPLPAGRIPHMTDFLAGTVAAAGVERPVRPVLEVAPEAREAIKARLKMAGYQAGDVICLVNIGAGNKLRCWGNGNFAVLVESLVRKVECCVVLTGTKDDHPSAAAIERAAATINTTGLLTLNELVALVSLSDLVITADTAVMHIASALDRPVVALFGAGLVDYCRPSSDNQIIIRQELGCSGCGDRCFTSELPPPCLTALAPQQVCEAAVSLLNRSAITEKE